MTPKSVRVVEVGPRDGLQNEASPISAQDKVRFIQELARAGFQEIEVASFVHPRWVPQLADSAEVFQASKPGSDQVFTALVPNLKGLERALEVGCQRVAVFTAASETFSQRNTNRSLKESLADLAQVMDLARQESLSVRGYVSTVVVCPYEGEIDPSAVLEMTQALLELGVEEVSLGDTVGMAVPQDVSRLLDCLLEKVAVDRLALHFHDTCGTALANVAAGLGYGVSVFDSSAGGLGGCPYAPGAAGNLATEDLLYFLTRSGIEHGVELDQVAQASRLVGRLLGKQLPSRQLQRLASR